MLLLTALDIQGLIEKSAAWFLPASWTVIGTVLYLAAFPGYFDASNKISLRFQMRKNHRELPKSVRSIHFQTNLRNGMS